MRLACWRARPRDRELPCSAALITWSCFEDRSFRRDAAGCRSNGGGFATQHAGRVRYPNLPSPLALQAAPPANNVSATLPRLAIRRDCADRSDREKIVSFRKGEVARDFGASGDFHQTALHQRLQHAIDVHAAHRFYVRAGNRLAIRDDRQRLQRRRTQTRRLRRGKSCRTHFAKPGSVASCQPSAFSTS